MKKIISVVISSLLLLSLFSCSEKERAENYQLTVNTVIDDLEIDVKSGQLSGTDYLYVGIFQENEQLAIVGLDDPIVVQGGRANAVISLVADQTYDLVFWAQGATAKYNIDYLNSITIPDILPTDDQPTLTLSASKQYDAFCAVLKGVNFSGSITQEVRLQRVGGVLNILHSEELSKGDIKSTTVKYNSYAKFNPLAESVTDKFSDEKTLTQTIIFPSTSVSDDFVVTETINGTKCTVLARSYFFTPEKKFREVKITTTKNDNSIKETTLTSVPFEQNKKTNLIGNFI
ncbi:MAG: hypothetical protein J6V04_08215 [Bacteroidales bacterium]|nr:hypothetical protein [Bacteroidales bacterium]